MTKVRHLWLAVSRCVDEKYLVTAKVWVSMVWDGVLRECDFETRALGEMVVERRNESVWIGVCVE